MRRGSQTWWAELEAFFREEVRRHRGSVQSYLRARNPVWNLVGRVYFHLAENKHDRRPSLRVSRHLHDPALGPGPAAASAPRPGAPRPLPATGRRSCRSLAPVDRAAAGSPLLKELVDTGDIFQPLAWTPREAHRFLQDVPVLEAAGVIVRVPDWWNADRPRRLEVSVTVGGKPPSTLGLDALLDFSVALTLDGEPISDAEWREILAGSDGLALVRGKWVELDREKLREVLGHWETRAARGARRASPSGRRCASWPGRRSKTGEPAAAPEGGGDWSRVVAGEWLATTLAHLRTPEGLAAANPEALRTVLRPYQAIGVRWLWFLSRLGLGACLADDMGLGKTIQVLGLLLLVKRGATAGAARVQADAGPRRPSLLVVPASLIANWQQEIAPVRARSRGVRGSPVGAAEPRARRAGRGGSGRRRPRHHHLRPGAAPSLARRGRVDPAGARRGAGDQESRRPAGAGGQAPPEPGAGGPDGHADREPARRSLVAVRLPEPRPPGQRPGVHAGHPGAGGRRGPPLRAAPGAGAALHPAAAQDRPPRSSPTCPTRPRCARSAPSPGSRPPSTSRR